MLVSADTVVALDGATGAVSAGASSTALHAVILDEPVVGAVSLVDIAGTVGGTEIIETVGC